MSDECPASQIEVYARAAAHTRGLIAGTRDRQRNGPTGLPGWDVARLIDHVAEISAAGVEVFAGERPVTGGDPITSYDAAVGAFVEAAGRPGTLSQTWTTFMGEMTGAQLVMALAMDNLIHGWDLAKATGQNPELPAEAVRAIYDTYAEDTESEIEPAPTVAQLRQYGSLGPAVTVPPDAPTQDRLITMMGRTP